VVPDGTKIAFGSGEIYVIAPDGTGLKRILRAGPRYGVMGPEWSPTGSHIAYARDDWSVFPRVRDVYRATASGSSPTNLTPDISNVDWVAGWR
jgi:Tol biopolymer transport system component